MPLITLTILGLQPEQGAAEPPPAPRLPLPYTAWQWPNPTPAAPRPAQLAQQPTHLIGKALRYGRARAAQYPSPITCPDDPEARLLARFAPTAAAHESAALALLADLATDTALKAALSQSHGLVAISRLAPAHLQAGTDHAVVMGARYLHLSAAEWQPLAQDLNQWLKPDGLILITAASGRCYLGYTAAGAARMGAHDLPPLGCALNRNAQPLLEGDALRGMRRWLTELQMWLYAHPLNVHRAEQGRPELNSLWVWGRSRFDAQKIEAHLNLAPKPVPEFTPSPTAASAALAEKHSAPLIYTDSAVLAGALIRTTGAPPMRLAPNVTPQCDDLPERVLTGAQPLHLIWSEPAWCYLEGDINGWQQSLDAIEHFVQALSAPNPTQTRLMLDDGLSRQWLPARRGLARFWPFFR